MKTPTTKDKMAEFEALCRKEGLPLTVQRRAVLEALSGRLDHPTADQLFEAVAPRVPGLSRTTVYRVLETLVKVGVIREAGHFGAAARYDPHTHRHHHLVCVLCHKVLDLEDPKLDSLALPKAGREGFEIEDYSVFFKGKCPDCRKTAGKRGRGLAVGKGR